MRAAHSQTECEPHLRKAATHALRHSKGVPVSAPSCLRGRSVGEPLAALPLRRRDRGRRRVALPDHATVGPACVVPYGLSAGCGVPLPLAPAQMVAPVASLPFAGGVGSAARRRVAGSLGTAPAGRARLDHPRLALRPLLGPRAARPGAARAARPRPEWD